MSARQGKVEHAERDDDVREVHDILARLGLLDVLHPAVVVVVVGRRRCVRGASGRHDHYATTRAVRAVGACRARERRHAPASETTAAARGRVGWVEVGVRKER